MRKYDELTTEQQARAQEVALNELLQAIVEGPIRDFADEDVQARIDEAFRKADEMQTPWFAHEYIMDDEKVSEYLKDWARGNAKEAFYPHPGEAIIRLPHVNANVAS